MSEIYRGFNELLSVDRKIILRFSLQTVGIYNRFKGLRAGSSEVLL
jgi:hypothetical protein